MSIISSHWKELVSLGVSVKKKCGMQKCSTMQSKSCSRVLCHRGVPGIFARRLYITICLRMSSSLILGFVFTSFYVFIEACSWSFFWLVVRIVINHTYIINMVCLMWKVKIMHSLCILIIHWNVFYHRKHHGHVGIKKQTWPFPKKDHFFHV
jgi:hypothetical protein